MRESGRGGEIYKGMPVEPRSAEREREALKRYHDAGEGNWEWRMRFRDFTDEDQRRLVKLRGWPTDRAMDAMHEDPKHLAYVRWTAEDLAACEAARAQACTTSSDPARPPVDD